MEVELGYQWFLEVCKSEGLNPKAVWVQEPLKVAKRYSLSIKRAMNRKETVSAVHEKALDDEIHQLHEKRIQFMLEALEMARANNNLTAIEDEFVRNAIE